MLQIKIAFNKRCNCFGGDYSHTPLVCMPLYCIAIFVFCRRELLQLSLRVNSETCNLLYQRALQNTLLLTGRRATPLLEQYQIIPVRLAAFTQAFSVIKGESSGNVNSGVTK